MHTNNVHRAGAVVGQLSAAQAHWSFVGLVEVKIGDDLTNLGVPSSPSLNSSVLGAWIGSSTIITSLNRRLNMLAVCFLIFLWSDIQVHVIIPVVYPSRYQKLSDATARRKHVKLQLQPHRRKTPV